MTAHPDPKIIGDAVPLGGWAGQCRRHVKANPLSARENGPTFQDREGVEGGGLG
jgi:hypothetical protein